MRLRDARDQVEREHPELTGQAKLEAIKALRNTGKTDDGQKSAATEAAHCAQCDQDVKPVQKHGWRNFLAWIALLEFGSVIAAIVNAVSAVDPDAAGGGIGRLILWPAAVHPSWLGIVASIVAFLVVAALAGVAGERAEKKATCPKCGLRLTAPAPSDS